MPEDPSGGGGVPVMQMSYEYANTRLPANGRAPSRTGRACGVGPRGREEVAEVSLVCWTGTNPRQTDSHRWGSSQKQQQARTNNHRLVWNVLLCRR